MCFYGFSLLVLVQLYAHLAKLRKTLRIGIFLGDDNY